MAALVAMVLTQGCQPAAHDTDRQPVLHEKQVGRAQAEHDERVAIEAIAELPPAGQREVLVHRQRVDIADAATFEVAGAGVVDGVAAPPSVVGRQRQRADARGPTQSLAARRRKKEPCPQSCWIMKRRTRKPAAGTATSRLSQ